ncbi:MAG: nucleotidyltransferase domain-containing protein [Bacteroidales bacterium]|nr:nucleotidyltransferase domain-containing protein [Bacteroidales bacterium]
MSSNDIKLSLSDYFRHQPVERAWLFGSFARGEETEESDIDLLVDLDDTQGVGLRFFGMWRELEQMLGRTVDLVTENGLADYARESVDRDKIMVYERAR